MRGTNHKALYEERLHDMRRVERDGQEDYMRYGCEGMHCCTRIYNSTLLLPFQLSIHASASSQVPIYRNDNRDRDEPFNHALLRTFLDTHITSMSGNHGPSNR